MRAFIGGAWVIALAGTGCAFVDRTAPLEYRAEGPGAPLGEARVWVLDFADERPDPLRIGDVRNGFGMRTAAIRVKSPVAGWVKDALIQELRLAGINAVPPEEAGPHEGPRISGQVIDVVCEMILSYAAKLTLKIDAVGPKGEPFQKILSEEGSGGVNLVGSSEGCGKAMTDALRKLLKRAVPELVEALKR